MERLRITLIGEEYGAWVKLCEAELRSPEEQLHHLLRHELSERKLLEKERSGHAREAERVQEAAR